jgi:hypothetical protein
MAILNCSPDNFDKESRLAFEIELLDKVDTWLNYKIKFQVGTTLHEFASKSRQVLSYVGTKGEIGKFALSLSPVNELDNLKLNLSKFVENSLQEYFRFEPLDPSFEIEITRVADQFKVYVWVDAGNTTQLAYTWDAIGIRFMTDRSQILQFLRQL